MQLEYKILKEILAEQKKTNELIAELIISKGGVNIAHSDQKQSEPTNSGECITDNNVKQRGSRKS
jgi:hypothetical protein